MINVLPASLSNFENKGAGGWLADLQNNTWNIKYTRQFLRNLIVVKVSK